MENENDFGFVLKAVLGGIIGGILSAIPVLNILNCCFCLLNGAGAALGVSLHCRSDPNVRMSLGQGAISGAISGLVAAGIATVANVIVSFVLGSMMASMFRSLGLPREITNQMLDTSFLSIMTSACFNVVLFTVFGALFGMLALKFMHGDQIDE
jgi:hypothetical protein